MGFKMIYWTPISGSYFLKGCILEKCGNFWKKLPFFRADMAGLGKYCTGGYGRIGVYRVKVRSLINVKHLFNATVESHHATNIIIMEFVINTVYVKIISSVSEKSRLVASLWERYLHTTKRQSRHLLIILTFLRRSRS